mgnify:CR=1 FL=1
MLFYERELRELDEVAAMFMSLIYPDDSEHDFWEPVKVTVSLDSLPVRHVDNWECPLCVDERREMYKLPCCNGKLCTVCAKSWFENENVTCPYCRKDMREFIPSTS